MIARILVVVAALAVCAPALADNFDSAAGGPAAGVVIERRLGTSGRTGVPVDENNPLPVTSIGGTSTTSPGTRTIVPLDVSTVTTGGTAVTALSAGHATAGGFVLTANAAGICVSQNGAAGTSTAGSTICVPQNTPFNLVPSVSAVSVNSSGTGVAFGGEGLQ